MKRYGVLCSLIMVGSLAAQGDEEDYSPGATSTRMAIFQHPQGQSGDCGREQSFFIAWGEERLAMFQRRLKQAAERGSQPSSPSGSPDEIRAFQENAENPSAIAQVAQHVLQRGEEDDDWELDF